MGDEGTKDRRCFELMLIVIAIGMAWLVYRMGAHKVVVLNLFFLPVVLSGYYLGRTSAGVLAVLCAVLVSISTTLSPSGFSGYDTMLGEGLVITVWAGVLGLTALLVGTLCDERSQKVDELHTAYIGVVEVLSKYLQSANPRVKARSIRVAELSQQVAREMHLSRSEINDIRVAALLQDIGNVEITTKLINRAVDTLGAAPPSGAAHTFLGMELVHSLGPVLSGAMPLLMNQDDAVLECMADEEQHTHLTVPLGAKIIRTVRAYYDQTQGESGPAPRSGDEVLREFRVDPSAGHDPHVLRALGRVVQRSLQTDTETVIELPAAAR